MKLPPGINKVCVVGGLNEPFKAYYTAAFLLLFSCLLCYNVGRKLYSIIFTVVNGLCSVFRHISKSVT